EQQRKTLAYSDTLVAELQNADVLVIGVSMYNFSITATLKAWIDMIARARLTFRYTENGPQGLLSGKKAYLVVATGGVPVGSPMDFATPYLRHALAFVGITDVEIVAADRLNSEAEESLNKAREQIANLVHLTTEAA
ncbi:MAG: NAD(P)H-dependent oxidoreductase, partial [Proteobacteria bacterium]|nr:NAD(P)H-dependent oxidoreductase [Pseudomonadota bacterium]